MAAKTHQPVPYPFTSTYAPPPRSKARFYSTSPHWSDVTPIPQITHEPNVADPGPALATIAYSERYTEAMEYLRGVMATGVGGERVLSLTEDVILMNPAHYTVWGLRMKVLRGMWGVDSSESVVEEFDESDKEKRLVEGVHRELNWLEGVSEKNLKNYQIWYLHPHPSTHPIPSYPIQRVT
jgi:protein farnesyltransferase/geranylgeranyltransferase type-1 subunit alpha